MSALNKLESLINKIEINDIIAECRPIHDSDNKEIISLISILLIKPDILKNEEDSQLKSLIESAWDASVPFSASNLDFSFGKDTFKVVCLNLIKSEIVNFILNNLPTKNAKATKLYKWYKYDAIKTAKFDEFLVIFYEHMKSFTHGTSKVVSYDTKKASDAFKLLEYVMENKSKFF
mgnify:CR=1 FL=1